MRRITSALLLISCLAFGGIAQAESLSPASQPQQGAQYVGAQPPAKNKSKGKTEAMKPDTKVAKGDEGAQTTCSPSPARTGEGDPDAPQNHIEYGG